MDINVHITAPDLCVAIAALAHALAGKKPVSVSEASAPVVEAPAMPQPTPVGTGVAAPQQAVPVVTYPAPTVPTVPTVPTTPTAPTAPTAPAAPPVAAVPVAATPAYNLDQIANAAAELARGGRLQELQGLLAKYGVQALPALNPDHYGAFATDLRGLGAKI